MRHPLLSLAVLALAAGGCVSPAEKDASAKHAFFSGRFDHAATLLDKSLGPDAEGKDALLFLLERGVILHTAGRYEESNRYLREAAWWAEELDVVKLSEELGTIVTNESLREYRPEDEERVLIHLYLAMNYAILGELEESLAECRRVQEELYYQSEERRTDFKRNPFALYLSGMIYEAMGNDNDAYIDYKKVHALASDFPDLPDDLLRTSSLMGFTEEYEEWVKKYGREAAIPPRGSGEIVVILQCGQAPVKVPHRSFPVVPEYQSKPRRTVGGEVVVKGAEGSVRTNPLYDVEESARRKLDGRTAGLVAKRLAIIAAKEVGVQVLEHSMKKKYDDDIVDLIGLLLRVILYSQEQADLRCWQTLPANFQIARLTLQAGKHDLTVRFIGKNGETTGSAEINGVDVRPSEWTFLTLRTVN